ncbi:helix-turn-helix transcriptional regulator [Candidatus Woesebacteria bacterium]|nr:helix-turn-helix transcriptional regulator [Candidatus Woesebacteria bacterium]
MEELKRFVESKRIPVTALAVELKVSRDSIYRYLNGTRTPSRALQAHIAQTLARLSVK